MKYLLSFVLFIFISGCVSETTEEKNKASVFIAIFLPNQVNASWTILAQGYTNTDNNRKNAMNELLQFMFHSLEKITTQK